MFRLLLVACLVVVAVNGLSQELKEKFMERLESIGGECATEVGANEDDIAELIAHKWPSRHEGECMIFCFYRHFDMMHADGSLHAEGAIKMMEPLKADDPDLYEKFMTIGKQCAEEVKSQDDKCKFATELAQCGVKKGKEMGLDESLFE
ncbi:pheromone-binding protein-like [Coccinella septempunctata]|uniref:pheromone-binding protein-like n=1 Tax=Coccinella septempunctata TaxID=41139 RepID=UPI001D07BFAD|nr:pheromone-binding protein-like [Coccinella septempunctata]